MKKLLWKLLLGMLIVWLNDFMYDSFFYCFSQLSVSIRVISSSTEFMSLIALFVIALFVMTFHLKLFRILTINAESNQLLSGILFTE